MSIRWVPLGVLFLLLPGAGNSQETGGEVRLSLPRFESLFTEATEARKPLPLPQPPLSLVLAGAALEVTRLEGGLRVKAQFEVDGLSDAWSILPLLPGKTAVVAAKATEGSFALVDGTFSFVSKTLGRRSIEVEWMHPASGLAEGMATELPLPAAAAVSLQIKPEAEMEPLVEQAVALGEGKYAVLPGRSLKIRFVPRATEQAELTPARWEASREVFAKFENERARLRTRLSLRLVEGGGADATLRIPSTARVLNVTSDEIGSSKVERLDSQTNLLKLRWTNGASVQREIILETEMLAPVDGARWTLMPPLLDGEKEPPVWFALIVPEEMESIVVGIETNSSQPGLWLQREAREKRAKFALGRPSVEVTLKSQPILETPKVSATAMVAKSKIVEDGALVSEITYTLRHQPDAQLRVQLPEGSKLLSSRIGEHPVQPVRESETQIRLPLHATSGDSKVSVSFYQKKEAWKPLRGNFLIALPLAFLMTEKVEWTVSLPEKYELEAYEGNVISSGAVGAISFRKELCNDEAPFVEIFYQKQEQ